MSMNVTQPVRKNINVFSGLKLYPNVQKASDFPILFVRKTK